jgi:hypothetical protein
MQPSTETNTGTIGGTGTGIAPGAGGMTTDVRARLK